VISSGCRFPASLVQGIAISRAHHVGIVVITLLIGALFILQAHAAPDDVEQVADPAANEQQNNFLPNLDQWIFPGAANIAAAEKQISARIKLQLEDIDRACGLTAEQKQKLQLAAGGDKKQLFEQVEALRAKFVKAGADNDAINQIAQDVQPLQTKVASGLCGDRSLLGKTLRTTLSAEQLAKFETVRGARARFRYQASIEMSLISLEKSVPLTAEQHEALVQLLLAETPPPAAFNQQENYYVMYQLAMLPRANVTALLDERQKTLLEPQLRNALGMKQFLVQQGMIAKDENEDAPVKRRNKKQPSN
jgi:hypothetical protein